MQIFREFNNKLDGGSCDLITSIGEIHLTKVLRNPNNRNGFYMNGKKVDEELSEKIQKALDDFREVKRKDIKCLQVKNAIKVLTKALKEDDGYRIGWKANIAMAFCDEFYKQANECEHFTKYLFEEGGVHTIANKASENFIDLLCTDSAKNR